MTDLEDTTVPLAEPATEPTMSDPQEQLSEEPTQPEPKKPEKMHNISFSIWPPSQRTRDAVINRLIETLSTPSVLSRRYGTIPADEASAAAKSIEEEAYSAAGGSATAADDDGIEILQIYSKEISKRMLEAVKARAGSASVPDDGAFQSSGVAPSTPATVEEVSSVETESS